MVTSIDSAKCGGGPDGANGSNGDVSALELISTATASNDATVEFTGLSSSYRWFIVEISNLVVATDDVDLLMRTSTDNGTTWDSGASDYVFVHRGRRISANLAGYNYAIDFMRITAGGSTRSIGNATNENMCATVMLFNPSDTNYTFMQARSSWMAASGDFSSSCLSGIRLSAADVDAIQFYLDSGNITSGRFTLYGVK